MDRDAVISIIESTLRKGNRIPGIFDLPKVVSIKSEMQSCACVDEVLGMIEKHRDTICRVFGLRADAIEAAMSRIRALEP